MKQFLGMLLLLSLPVTASAQFVVSGTVTDLATGEPMPYVSVAVAGTFVGTTTARDGTYVIRMPAGGGVLSFSFVGYRMQSIQVEPGQSTLDVQMQATLVGLGDLVVVGTRRTPRLITEVTVPIDVLSPQDLETSSSLDLDDVIRTQIPSYNVQRHEIDGSTTFVRPPTLRGLSPDNTILLVNGKRRHRTASIALFGSALILGAQGADINMIPSIAIKQFEVLRDGASAQYGADAVAGVFNMQLKDAPYGFTVRSQVGQYHQGDGRYVGTAANLGLPLTDRGFVNLSLEYRNADPTIRSEQRDDAKLLASRGYPVAEPAQIWGSPDLEHSVVGFVNAGVDLAENTSAYLFGGYGQRTGNGGYYFRAPGTGGARLNVFRFGAGEDATRAVIDLDLEDDIDCRNLADLPSLDSEFQAVEDFISRYKGSCFLFNERFPGGFTPRFGIDMSDASATAGVRSMMQSGLRWDVSGSMGRSLMDYFINNTVNASYGPDTPTSFRQRDFLQEEYSFNVEMSYPWDLGFLQSPLNAAWGLNWRTEIFTTRPGDIYSYNKGPYAEQGFSVGSNGDQGIPPEFTGTWSRPNYAVYLDLEADVTPKVLLNVAARMEDYYESFGTTLTGKVAGMVRAAPGLRFRASVSTGFRAPTPGQANLQNVQTNFSGDGGLIDAGQLPSTHPVARALGGRELKEETARNFAAGFVAEVSEDAVLSVDYFSVSLRDRIALTGSIPLSDQMADILNSKGLLSGFETLREIKFFSNDFGTNTRGIDMVFSWDREWREGRATIVTAAYNWTRTRLVQFSAPRRITTFLDEVLRTPATVSVLSPRRKIELETANPAHRAVLTGRQIMDPLHGLLRLHYYSGWEACLYFSFSCTVGGEDGLRSYSGQWIIDLEAGYRFLNNFQATFGVNNVLASAPDADPIETGGQGNLHPPSTPWDYNGAALYLRLNVNL